MQFWDKKWLLSKTLGGPQHLPRSDGLNKIGFDMDEVIWDFVAIYAPGSDRPSFTGAPVFRVADDMRRQLAMAPPR